MSKTYSQAATDAVTPADLANLWLELTRTKKEIAKEIEAIEAALRGHVMDTGETMFGDKVLAFQKAKPATLVLINDKYDLKRQMDALLEELMDTEYIKRSLDVTGIHKAAPYEKQVERALLKCKLASIQEHEWYFKPQ